MKVSVDCPNCKATGKVIVQQFHLDQVDNWSYTCAVCKGRGKIVIAEQA